MTPLRECEREEFAHQLRLLARFPDENPNPVLRIDPRGVLTYANAASAALLAGLGWRSGERGPDAIALPAARAAAQGRAVAEEVTLGDRTYSLDFAPGADGGHVNVYGKDITDWRRAEASLRESLVATVEAIAAVVEARDPYTGVHQRRVAELATAIARDMGLDESAVEGIHLGALVHDVGKLHIPSELLAKPTKLSALEFELIKTHAQAGYELVKPIRFPWPIASMVHQHHERLDGSGYPRGLKGEAIAPEARILAVADVVEAMTSSRPYREALGPERALQEIQDRRGTWFEPRAVDACVRLFREKAFLFRQGGMR